MGCAACPADDAEPEIPAGPVTVATITGWVRVTDTGVDAFAAFRPAEVPCDETGVGVEPLGLSFEIKTGLCDYATVAQPTIEPLQPGDVLGVRVWHDVLDAPAPATGYVGLAIEGEIVWHATAPIPSGVGVINGEVTIDRELPAGTELQYHVHNHGINSWNLLDIETKVEDGT